VSRRLIGIRDYSEPIVLRIKREGNRSVEKGNLITYRKKIKTPAALRRGEIAGNDPILMTETHPWKRSNISSRMSIDGDAAEED